MRARRRRRRSARPNRMGAFGSLIGTRSILPAWCTAGPWSISPADERRPREQNPPCVVLVAKQASDNEIFECGEHNYFGIMKSCGPISIRVKNLDSAPMDFESVSLRVEKVIAPSSEGVVNVRALAPGRYEFFDDFHQQTRGVLVVE